MRALPLRLGTAHPGATTEAPTVGDAAAAVARAGLTRSRSPFASRLCSQGLSLVVLTGAELVTGNFFVMTTGWLAKRVSAAVRRRRVAAL